jgi:transposase
LSVKRFRLNDQNFSNSIHERESLSTEEEEILEQLCQHPALSAAIVLTQRFLNLVRQRLPEQLDDWLTAAKDSSIRAFQDFAKGLKEDYDAVKAGVTLEISNGQVEGQNNRLKMLKRQMFGRAGLDLLAKRFILKG